MPHIAFQPVTFQVCLPVVIAHWLPLPEQTGTFDFWKPLNSKDLNEDNMNKTLAMTFLCTTLSTTAIANSYNDLTIHQHTDRSTIGPKTLIELQNAGSQWVQTPLQAGAKPNFDLEEVDVHLPPPEDDKQKIA
ncbi:hypothetical protein [Microbulbifer taiwanensis]|uniref:Uncharacterized protein n=1 Tax=Microbulbifer taiwanensis TaxID=986746 RepID=A0ABW1YRQ2_9GAMM|nr:hypothetical protein [Microbulbifer taiwanensis]